LIVERYLENTNFKPKDYYEIVANFDNYNGKYIDKDKNSKIEKEETANNLIEKLKGKNGKVKSIKKSKKKVSPPLLYDLTELQREANRKYGFSANDTLKLAQSLYETHKLTTYPRTDSKCLTEDMVSILKPTLEKIKDSL